MPAKKNLDQLIANSQPGRLEIQRGQGFTLSTTKQDIEVEETTGDKPCYYWFLLVVLVRTLLGFMGGGELGAGTALPRPTRPKSVYICWFALVYTG
jgi:hypothetical protein